MRTIPVLIGRKAQVYTPMTTAMWNEFKRGAPQEFMINEAVADMGDPRIVGEVNRLRGKMEIKDTLDKLYREAHHRVDEITREALAVENDLVDTMARIEARTSVHSSRIN